ARPLLQRGGTYLCYPRSARGSSRFHCSGHPGRALDRDLPRRSRPTSNHVNGMTEPARRRRAKASLPVALAFLLAACSGIGTTGSLHDDPLVRGPVETIDHRAHASGILVRATPGSREMCGIAATVDG